MSAKSITDIVAKIVGELTPLDSEERKRVVQASLMLLGETAVAETKSAADTNKGEESSLDAGELSPRARTWSKQNGLSQESLSQIFHQGSDGVEIIVADIPGKGNRDKVRNAYVLLGIAKMISTGEPSFDDKDARALCERYGFLDSTNHAKYIKGGNEFTGSKDRGWTLTAPGLKHAATLVAELS